MGPIGQRTVLLKTLNEIEQLPDDSTDIAMSNFQSRYPSRPALLENVCLAEWFSCYAIRYTSAKKESRSNEDPLAHGDSMDSDSDTDLEESACYRCRKQTIRKINNPPHFRIIRYTHYDRKKDPENYCRELLQLYVPFEKEDESGILGLHFYFM